VAPVIHGSVGPLIISSGTGISVWSNTQEAASVPVSDSLGT
jgi:hypothetical protein